MQLEEPFGNRERVGMSTKSLGFCSVALKRSTSNSTCSSVKSR